jgi:hypothetical protein
MWPRPGITGPGRDRPYGGWRERCGRSRGGRERARARRLAKDLAPNAGVWRAAFGATDRRIGSRAGSDYLKQPRATRNDVEARQRGATRRLLRWRRAVALQAFRLERPWPAPGGSGPRDSNGCSNGEVARDGGGRRQPRTRAARGGSSRIHRFATGFCHGLRYEMRRGVVPITFINLMTSGLKIASRSRMRYFGAVS